MLNSAADWDYRNQCTDSMTPSQTRKGVDSLDRQQDNRTDPTRSHVSSVISLKLIALKTKITRKWFNVETEMLNKAIMVGLLWISGHSSPGGDLSDEELCSGIAMLDGGSSATPIGSGIGPHEFEPLCIPPSSGHMEFAQPPQQQQQCARSRSGSCASRRSQFRYFFNYIF